MTPKPQSTALLLMQSNHFGGRVARQTSSRLYAATTVMHINGFCCET